MNWLATRLAEPDRREDFPHQGAPSAWSNWQIEKRDRAWRFIRAKQIPAATAWPHCATTDQTEDDRALDLISSLLRYHRQPQGGGYPPLTWSATTRTIAHPGGPPRTEHSDLLGPSPAASPPVRLLAPDVALHASDDSAGFSILGQRLPPRAPGSVVQRHLPSCSIGRQHQRHLASAAQPATSASLLMSGQAATGDLR